MFSVIKGEDVDTLTKKLDKYWYALTHYVDFICCKELNSWKTVSEVMREYAKENSYVIIYIIMLHSCTVINKHLVFHMIQ